MIGNPVGERCPPCNSPRLLDDDPIGTVYTSIEDDEVIQRQGMLPSKFECVASVEDQRVLQAFSMRIGQRFHRDFDLHSNRVFQPLFIG